MNDFFELGKALKPQGIKGEIKLSAYTDDISRFSYLKYVFLKDNNGEFIKTKVLSSRYDNSFAYIILEGYEDRDKAETLRNRTIYVDRENAAKLPEGHYYIKDLIGLDIVDTKGNKLGVLKDILQNGSKDVYVVSAENSFMFPSLDFVILKKDIENGVIVVDKDRLSEVCIYDI